MEETSKKKLELIFSTFLSNKDEKSFRVLFYEYFTPLCAFAYSYLEDKTDCEDVVQDVFFRLWKNREHLIIVSSGKNFLLTSVRNAALDLLRKRKIEEQWNDNVANVDFDAEEIDLYTYKELKQAITEALDKLPPKISTTFKLNRFQGQTYAEIAELNNLSVKTIEAYMSKAIAFLKVELKEFLPLFIFFFKI